MTTEEKAKAYDKAIEIAKSYHDDPNCFKHMEGCLEHIFPELAESEDERIRKKVIDVLKLNIRGAESQMQASRGVDRTFEVFACEKVIAWLEKQGEQKSYARYKVGDTIYYDSFGRLVSFTIANIVEDGTDNPMYEDKDGNSVFQNDIVEQNPAWSEEDDRNLSIAIQYVFQHGCLSTVDWLKSLKDRVGCEANCTTKQEWSEEDERNLQGIIDEIEATKNHAPSYDLATYDRYLSWLKSLRPQKQELSEQDKELLIFNKLTSLGYPCDANGNIPTYEETFDMCKNGLIYWLQEKAGSAVNDKYISLSSNGVKTETLLKENYVQAFKEGIDAAINILSSQTAASYPQKQWKPTEYQMKAVEEALSLAKNCGEEYSFDLRTLLEQLKALQK